MPAAAISRIAPKPNYVIAARRSRTLAALARLALVSRTADKAIGEAEQPAAELVSALMRIVEHDDHLVTRIEQAVDDVSRARRA